MQVAESWFEIRRIGEGLTHITEPYADSFIRANLWHVRGRDRDLLVDAGLGVASVRRAGGDLFDGREVVAVATHSHYDHTGGMHEFSERLIHELDALALVDPPRPLLKTADLPPVYLELMARQGYELEGEFLTAYPDASFDPAEFRIQPAPATRLIGEGDVIDLGDRAFHVLHLPGHTPGSIALWEDETALLFSGDVVYDGPLLDELPGSNIREYVRTMKRLRELPVTAVHGGHEGSFGRERLIEIIDEYLARRDT
jgi:glyoxylase-like metal-dependent hydrolase (beta-lactamase superfamily II)